MQVKIFFNENITVISCNKLDMQIFKLKSHVGRSAKKIDSSYIKKSIAESFYYVNYGLSFITSKVSQKISAMKTTQVKTHGNDHYREF